MDARTSPPVEPPLATGSKGSGKPSPDRILELGLAFRASRVLHSAVELGLFSELASGPLDGEALRRRLDIHGRGAHDFFDTLVALGMLERRDGIYSNTPETDLYLDPDKITYVGGMIELAGELIYPVWLSLTDALRTGEPHGKLGVGEDLFDFVYAEPQSLARFARAMTGASLVAAAQIARRFPWRDRRSVVDIGTAEGCALAEIANAQPHLAGVGFDLPQLRPIFESYAERRGLTHRLRFEAGDFLERDLPSADVLVMGQVLHDWNLEVKRMLLAKAFAALPQGGALIVYDQMIDDGRRQNAAGLLMSLSMLVATRGGFDYTVSDGLGWVREAGFRDVRQEQLTSVHSAVVGIK
jgi:hypothetical protein